MLRHLPLEVFATTVLWLVAIGAARAQAGKPQLKVGVADRTFSVDDLYNWRGAKTHEAGAVEQPQSVGARRR